MQPLVEPFFDAATSTFTYVVHAGDGTDCAIIDSVLDFDPKSGRTSTTSAERVVDFVRAHKLHVVWLLETHAHADHLSAAQFLRRVLGGRIAIGRQICTVQHTFKRVFNLGDDMREDGQQFDHLFEPDETFKIGALDAQAIHVPGHTPADMAYLIGDGPTRHSRSVRSTRRPSMSRAIRLPIWRT